MKQIKLKDSIQKIKSCVECPFYDLVVDNKEYENEVMKGAGYCNLVEKYTYLSTYEIQVLDECELEDYVEDRVV